MIIESPADLEGLKAAGRVVAQCIAEMKRQVRPGMTTAELDRIGEEFLSRHGALSAPKAMYDFPGATCISLNEEVAHGIPGKRVIKAGDLINIDVSAELNGYYSDSGVSFQISPSDERVERLCRSTEETMMAVIRHLRAGMKVNEIGKVMELEAKKRGYKVVRNLCSHGIGRALHEEPFEILPYYHPRDTMILQDGQVITVEPFLTKSAQFVEQQADGWTLTLPRGGRAAQFEHTIVVTREEPMILTKA